MIEKCCIILLLNLLVYRRTLKLGAVSDDIPGYQNPLKYKNKLHKLYLQIFEGGKFNLKQDHFITIIIHALVSMFIYLAFGANNISFIAGLLFSINPANEQGSIWISGRGYALPALFLLMAKTFVLLSPIFLLLCSFHISGFLSPLALIGSPQWYLILLMPIIWLIYFKRFKGVVKQRMEQERVAEDDRFHFGKIVMAVKTYGYYFLLCIIPFRLSFYHSFLQSAVGNDIMKKRAYKMDKFFWLGLSIIVFWTIYSINRWDNIAYGIFWFSICIAPFSNLVRMQQEIANRYLYQANIGVMLMVATLIAPYPFLIALFLGSYLTRLWYHIPAWTDDYWIIEDAVRECPSSWFAWHIRAMKRFESGALREALNMFVMAKMLSPKEFKVLLNIGVILKIIKRPKEAEEFFKKAEENIIEGQEEEARKILEEARSKTDKLPILK